VAWTPYSGGSYDITLGRLVIPTTPNGHTYCQIAATGVNGTTEPTWPTSGGTVSDGNVIWQDVGTTLPNTIYFQGEDDRVV
jgi:hypothetical protein